MSYNNVVSATAPARSLHVAVELPGAFGPHYWADLTAGSPDEGALDLSASRPNVVRIRATDLRETRKVRDRVRAELAAEGRDPDSVTVLVDLEVVVAPDARSARKQYAQLDIPRTADTLSYVGTPRGLAGLIADIFSTHVADGVTLVPLAPSFTVEYIVDGTLGWLESRDLVVPAPSVVEVLHRFGSGAVGLVRAS